MPAFLIPLLGSKWTWIAAGVVIAITAAGLYVLHVHNAGVAQGAAAVTAKIQARTIEVQGKITDAEARGPRTVRDVSKLLRDGTF